MANEDEEDPHRLLTKICVRLPHNIAMYLFTTLRGAAGQATELQTEYVAWAAWPPSSCHYDEPRTKAVMQAGKEMGSRLDAKMNEKWTCWQTYLAFSQQHECLPKGAMKDHMAQQGARDSLCIKGLNRTIHGDKKTREDKGRHKHNLLFDTACLEPTSMDAAWAYMKQFVWKHPLQTSDADVILADIGGHTRVQAYEMVVTQSAEEGNARSTAAFILDCLNKAQIDAGPRASENPDVWKEGAPWIIIPGDDLAKMEKVITRLHTQNSQWSHWNEPTWQQNEWVKHAPGDRDSFRMLQDADLVTQGQKQARLEKVTMRPSRERAGTRYGGEDHAKATKASKPRSAAQTWDRSTSWWEHKWTPGQDAGSGSGAAQASNTDVSAKGSARPLPPTPPPAPKRPQTPPWWDGGRAERMDTASRASSADLARGGSCIPTRDTETIEQDEELKRRHQ